MRPYLTFTLSGVMGSFGGSAPNERRPTALRPSRSAVLGLIAACRGIDRADRDALVDLTNGIGVATAMVGEPRLELDYQTIQSPNPVEIRRGMKVMGCPPVTRAEALARPSPSTTVTRREYLTNVEAVVAVWSRAGQIDLQEVVASLERPVYVPYLGRRAFPLTGALSPRMDDAVDAMAAIETRVRPQRRPLEVGTDLDDPCADRPDRRLETRRDASRHDPAWMYDERREAVVRFQVRADVEEP